MPYYKYDNTNKPTSNSRCNECNKAITDMQSFLQCDNSNCAKAYHPGCKAVFGVHISRIASQTTWYCCEKCGKNITSNNDSPSKTSRTNENADFKKIENMFNHITKQMEELMASQNFLNDQFEEIKKCNVELVKENSKLKNEVKQLQSELERQRKVTNQIEGEMDSAKQEALANNVVIAGCPKEAESNPKLLVSRLINLLGANINDNDISDLYALKTKNTKFTSNNNNKDSKKENKYSTMIIVKFKSTISKTELMNKKRNRGTIFVKELEGCDGSPADKQIFIRDQLTPLNQSLFREARTIKNNYNYTYLWFKTSKVCLRKASDSKVHIISNFNDLDIIKNQHEPSNNLSADQHNT